MPNVVRVVFDACLALIPSVPLALVITSALAGLVVAPVTVRAVRASARLQAIQPRLKRVQSDHAGDPVALRSAIVDLYREAGASPLTPLWLSLAQAPVGYGVYRAARSLRDAQLLGVDLTGSALAALHGPPIAALVVAALAVVVVAVSLAQSRSSLRRLQSTPGPMRTMTRLAPAIALTWAAAVPMVATIAITTLGAVRAGAVWFAERQPPVG